MGPDGTGDGERRSERRPQRRDRRHDQDRLDRRAGADGRLRPMPRPSLRSDLAGRLLSHAGAVRAGLRLEELAVARGPAGVAVARRSPQARRPRSKAELQEIAKQRNEELDKLVSETFERELAKLPAEIQAAARAARDDARRRAHRRAKAADQGVPVSERRSRLGLSLPARSAAPASTRNGTS